MVGWVDFIGFITRCIGNSVFGISLSDHEVARGSFEVKELGTSFICSLKILESIKVLVDRNVVATDFVVVATDVVVVATVATTVVRIDVDRVVVKGGKVLFGGRGRFLDPFQGCKMDSKSNCVICEIAKSQFVFFAKIANFHFENFNWNESSGIRTK